MEEKQIRVRFLEKNASDFYLRGADKYIRLTPEIIADGGVIEVGELAANELVASGRFEMADSEPTAQEEAPSKKSKKKKEE